MAVAKFYNRMVYHYKVAYTYPTRRESADGRGYYDKEYPTYQEEELRIVATSTNGAALVEAYLTTNYNSGDRILKSLTKVSEPSGIDGEITWSHK